MPKVTGSGTARCEAKKSSAWGGDSSVDDSGKSMSSALELTNGWKDDDAVKVRDEGIAE